MSDVFVQRAEVPVAGGALLVARAGPPVEQARAVVLAVHGITASHMAWAAVARRLAPAGVCVLAVDLRGRGGSAGVPGPYGMAAHVADLLAVLDHAGIRRVVLAGHSMGAYVVARLAAEQPERASGVVLVDGGLPIPAPADRDPDEVLEEVIGPALTRLGATFPSAGAYRAMWRDHPALAQAWDDDVEAYVLYDLEPAPDAEHPAAVRSSTSADAVRVDGRELLLDETTRTAIERVRAPLWLLRAPAGLMGDERALIPRPELDAFAAARPGAHVEEVDGVNHYTILIGPGPGPGAVAAAVEAALPLPGLALGVHASEDASR